MRNAEAHIDTVSGERVNTMSDMQRENHLHFTYSRVYGQGLTFRESKHLLSVPTFLRANVSKCRTK